MLHYTIKVLNIQQLQYKYSRRRTILLPDTGNFSHIWFLHSTFRTYAVPYKDDLYSINYSFKHNNNKICPAHFIFPFHSNVVFPSL